MINLSYAFRQKLYVNERDYLIYADITLANQTVLQLENDKIWSGGMSIEDAVSEDDNFTALGSAIIGAATLTINNMDESFSSYDFTSADVTLYIGMMVPDGNSTVLEKIQKGVYTVDDTEYDGALIVLQLLDRMERFDKPYSDPNGGNTLSYPATLDEIVRNACSNCDVTLGTLNFPHKDHVVQTRPTDDAITYREIIGWAAGIAGCFARCNRLGELELTWFDQTALENRNTGYDGGEFDSSSPYSTGDALDGGTFNPWSTGSEADGGAFTDSRPLHYIYALYSQNVCMDDVVITGIRILIENDNENSDIPYLKYTSGSSGYVIELSENKLIEKNNAQTIANWLGAQLIGLQFRKASFTHADDPSIEAGDVGILFDRKNREYPILITRTVFNVGSAQETVCGAETPGRNSATRYAESSKSYVANRKLVKQAQNPYAKALQDLAAAVNSATGLYETTVTDQTTGTTIVYRHNKPQLAQSDVVQMISSVGVTFTTNYQDTTPTWYGFAVDGKVVAKQISALGINFEWAVGTLLTLGGANNGNGVLRVVDENGDQIGVWTNTGLVLSNTRGKNTSSERTFETYIGNCFTLNNYNLGGYYYFVDNVLGNTDAMLKDANGDILAFHTIVPERDGRTGDGADEAPGIRECIYCSGGGVYKKLFTNETMVDDGGGGGGSSTGIAHTYSGQEEWRRDDKFVMRHAAYTSSSSPSSDWYLNISDKMFFYDSAFHNIWNTYVTGTVHFKISTAMIDICGGEYSLKIDQYGNLLNGNIIQTTSSSKRYKHNISEDICEKLDPHKLYKLKMKQFVYNEDHEPPYACMIGKTLPGFIAEDINEIYPSAVIKNKDGEIESWSEAQIIAPMLKLIQEQKQEIDDLKSRVAKLEKMIEKLL